jgi:hypothetical protein
LEGKDIENNFKYCVFLAGIKTMSWAR